MVHPGKGRGNGGVSGKEPEAGGRGLKLTAYSRQLTAKARDDGKEEVHSRQWKVEGRRRRNMKKEFLHKGHRDTEDTERGRGHDESCPYKREAETWERENW
jgi:hypothetical protein